jgi:hypothetical protein
MLRTLSRREERFVEVYFFDSAATLRVGVTARRDRDGHCG